jgi:hypothetical protein
MLQSIQEEEMDVVHNFAERAIEFDFNKQISSNIQRNLCFPT